MTTANMPTNLRRLLFFHHASAREAARALGVNEHSVSSWLNGKRPPGGQALMAIDRLYGISPRDLDLDEADFAQRLANRERIAMAESALRPAVTTADATAATRGVKTTAARVRSIQEKRKERKR